MKAFKFNLSGKTAFFKTPDVNAYLYYTYGHIHRVALLGLLGAIRGYSGYGGNSQRDWPEFYEKLKSLNISILPNNDDGIFSRKIQKFNNSTGFASHETGGNLIVTQTWLEDVSWDIFFLIDSKESENLADMILNKRCVYIPYLGSNDHVANINSAEYVELVVEKEPLNISSFIKSQDVDVDLDYENFKYEEILPIALERETERYIYEKFIYTNGDIEIKDKEMKVYRHEERNMVFYNAN